MLLVINLILETNLRLYLLKWLGILQFDMGVGYPIAGNGEERIWHYFYILLLLDVDLIYQKYICIPCQKNV